MAVFISHSFENKPEFDNIVDALVQANVPYWNPAEVKAGSSLRDQLRQALERCSVCIFIATHRSLESSWCGTELGAFWGAGKPVIVYLAEPSLADEELPPVVRGDIWERRISRVVARTKEFLDEVAAQPTHANSGHTVHVGSMTVEQLEKLIVGAISLAAAAGKTEGRASTPEAFTEAARGAAGLVLEGIKTTERTVDWAAHAWQRQILWVDDRPDNNVYERNALESMGIEFTLALSTQQALEILSKKRFAAIISDMGRKEGPREGYVFLEAVRASDQDTPFFIYAGSNAPAHKREAAALGAQGTTNRPQELFDMIIQALPGDASANRRVQPMVPP